MASADAAADIVDGDGQGDCFEVSAPNCAWVIPVLLDSHASAAATLAFSLRKFSSVKHVVAIAPDSLHPDIAAALKLVVDEFIVRSPPAILQPQIPRWKSDDGSFRMKLMKAHALSLDKFDKVAVVDVSLVAASPSCDLVFQLEAPAASCSVISYDAGWHGVAVPPHHVDASFSDRAFFTRCLLLKPSATEFSNFMNALSSFVCFQPYLPPDDHFFSSFFSGRLRHMPHSLVYEPAKGHSLCASEHAFLLHARNESLFWLEIAAEAASMSSSTAKSSLFPDTMFSQLQRMRDVPLQPRPALHALPTMRDGAVAPKRASLCIATCDESPRLVASGASLLRALQACGVAVQQRPWNSAGGWDEFSHICVMQTWDYPSHFSDFLHWLQSASLAGSIVLNDTRYINWNANKKYMLDLQADGVSMPRTVAMDCSDVARSTSPFGKGPGEPGDMIGQIAVVKPQVGCSALGVSQIIIGEESPVAGPVLLQEFVPCVSKGELSLIYFDGKFSHCVRKMPKAGEWRTNWKFGGRAHAERQPPAAALALAEQALEAAARHAFPPPAPAPSPPVWARVDCVMRGDEALLMELELIEPVLFLDQSPGAADCLARAIHQRVTGSCLPPPLEHRRFSRDRAPEENRWGNAHAQGYKRPRDD